MITIRQKFHSKQGQMIRDTEYPSTSKALADYPSHFYSIFAHNSAQTTR